MIETDQAPTGCVELGQLIRAARRSRRLSQAEVADMASGFAERTITRDRIAQWERAHRRIAAEDLLAVELALNVELTGVGRRLQSQHHAGAWCELDGIGAVKCRTRGVVIA